MEFYKKLNPTPLSPRAQEQLKKEKQKVYFEHGIK